MEFKPEDIAKLVLGYLREYKCHTAFREFLTNSPYLKEHVSNHRRGKYIATRIGGLSLVDYLAEYALVYSIVQEHIEASDYYNERGLRTSLAQQLHYLLGARSGIQSRTSTPIQDDILIHVYEENNTNKSNSITQPQITLEPTINDSFHITSGEINATPIQTLPGNTSTGLSFLNSSKNESGNTLPNVSVSTDTQDDLDNREKSQEMCKEIFTQTFLENTELIEKLADNINKEVSAKSLLLEDDSNFHIGQELDNNAIETIIQRFAEDPIVVHSIEEIIGSGENESESHGSPDQDTQNVQDIAELNTSTERALLSTPIKAQSMVPSSESIKTRLRSSKKSYPNSAENVLSVEEENNEVVQSIVAASLSGEKRPLDQESNTSIGTNTQTSSVGEVILSEQPYNTFIHTGALAGPSNHNQIYVNTVNSGGLIMTQSSLSSTCSNIVSTKTVQVDSVKPYYVIGNQPFGNVIIPQTPFKVSNVMTEQEIMAMPTIIVCDNNVQYATTQSAIVPTPATSSSTTQNYPRTIAPRKTVEKVQSLSEYITLYQCNDPASPIISQPPLESSSPNLRSKSKAASSTKRRTAKTVAQRCNNIQTPSETCTTKNSDILNNKLQGIAETATSETTGLKTEPNSIYHKSSHELEQNLSRNKPTGESMPQIVTPKMMIVQDVKERRSRSTPRNGSHVRQLDFSTPEKWCPTVRRANTSPKVNKTLDNKDTPVKAPKPGALKSIRTSLFKSPDLEFITDVQNLSAANNNKEDEQTKVDIGSDSVAEIIETNISQKTVKSVNLSWDADLRALAAPARIEESITQKQKRKRSEEPSKEHITSKKPKENLNKTEEEASNIEIALGSSENQIEPAETTPAKSAQEDVQNVKVSSTRRNRTTTKKANKAKNDNEKLPKTTKIARNPPDNNCSAAKIGSDEDVTPKLENQQKVASEENVPEKQYAVINRYVKSRIKKKCNMENSVKKTQMPEEIILTNITKIKSCEILDESKNKLILSPSKLNANKRTLVEVENRSPVETSVVTKATSDEMSDTQEIVTGSKLVTPELVKSSSNIPPVAAKRNIMPILETPVKFDSIIFPKTPSICTPTIDTPFTKAVLDQLTGVDINDIPTPKFPITPNVPFTPATGNEPSPFSNRATDYSTSSSYYQPSDTEQNKSLEQLLEECHKLDNQSVQYSNEVDECDGTLPSSISTCKNSETTKKAEISELVNSKSSEVSNTSIIDKMNAFNRSMIGQKNLHLVKMFSNEAEKDESSSSDSSSTGTSSSSLSDDSNSSDSDGDVKTTPNKNINPPYSLRPRKCLMNNTAPVEGVCKEIKEGQNTSLDKRQHSVKTKEKSLSFQDGLLQEMEEKRQRTIAHFKNACPTTKAKDRPKQKKQTPKTKENRKVTVKKDDSGKVFKKKPSKKFNSNKVNSNTDMSAVNESSKNEPNKQSELPKELKLPEISKNENFMILKQGNQWNPTRTSFVSTKKAKASVNDDKEIILHLSSDDENLEPSKMVEAVLLDCSTSSTSVGDENRVIHASMQSADTFDNGIDVTLTGNEQESQGTLDQEAETWVKLKGLMQMGIHLIPNKPAKKLAVSPEETEQLGVQTKENTSGKRDESAAKCDTEEMPSQVQPKAIEEKLEKLIDHKCKIKNAEEEGTSVGRTQTLEKATTPKEKPKTVEKQIASVKQKTPNPKTALTLKAKTENSEKPKNKSAVELLNRSLEEGELVSDDDKSPKKENKLKKHTKRFEPKRRFDSCRKDTGRKSVNQHDRFRAFREFYRYRPRSEKQLKESVSASTSKKFSSTKSSKLHENKIPDKNRKTHNKTTEKVAVIKPKNESATVIEKQMVINELDYHVQFDNKTYPEETYRITHDYSKETNRTLSDYNLNILTKKFSANVYIAEIDSEVEKFLTFTPFEFLLDIAPKGVVEKKTDIRSKSHKSQVSKEQIKSKKKPLNILYNQLIKPGVETPRCSLLEDLYSPEATSRNYNRSSEINHEKVVGRSKKSEKYEKTSRSRQKSSDEERFHTKSLENTIKHRNIKEQESTSSGSKSDLNSESNTSSINRERSKRKSGDPVISSDQPTKGLLHDSEQNLEVVDGVIMLNVTKEEQKKEEIDTSFEVNDELMNYALVGSERVEDLLIADNRKRKVSEELAENQQEKKQKTEELLKNIDVDSFLKKLHGET